VTAVDQLDAHQGCHPLHHESAVEDRCRKLGQHSNGGDEGYGWNYPKRVEEARVRVVPWRRGCGREVVGGNEEGEEGAV
jgi:hypothetical protein